MEIDLERIKELSKEKEEENWEFRLINVVHNCSICPIVYNVYEFLKGEVWKSFIL